MDAATRALVRERAEERCEYCLMPDSALDLPFHLEHIVASVHRADDRPTNLAWACPRCNLRKGPNLTTIDPIADIVVELFHPRTMIWTEHFSVRDGIVVGLTPCGRGTVELLDMNQEQRVQLRRRLIIQGKFRLD
jgi:hypothetical protein